MEIKVGQTWRTRGMGNVDVIRAYNDNGDFAVGLGVQNWIVSATGCARHQSRDYDLLTRVERVYIAGPMTGIPGLNFSAFNAAAADYRNRGCHVENPTEISPDTTMEWADCMRRDIPRLVTCDTIVLLPGWENSRGAKIEYGLAIELGMAVVYTPGATS